MLRKLKYLSLVFVVLFVLPLAGCVQGGKEPQAASIAGRVVLGENGGEGLAGVSLLIVDGTDSYVETDAQGQFKTAGSDSTVIIPRKTGYRFVPEQRVVGQSTEVEFDAYPWAEPDFSRWGVQFSFANHWDWVETMVFSPDDQYIVTGSNDRSIRIWRAADGQLIGTLGGHASGVKVMEFSPLGSHLASGSRDGKLKIWDWQAGREVMTLPGHAITLTDLAWSPDGTKLASSGRDNRIRIWDAASGAELQTFTDEKWVRTVAWSPDGSLLLSGGDALDVKVWRVESGELVTEFEMGNRVMVMATAPKALWLP